jgi:hypothetical protein
MHKELHGKYEAFYTPALTHLHEDIPAFTNKFKVTKALQYNFEISASHGGDYEDDSLLGCCAV